MTGEEALKLWLPVIKMGVESMPECSEALDMAIKALEQKPKSEWQQDHEILKAHSDGANEVLDIIKAEIESKYESIPDTFHHYETGFTDALEWVLSIIDKYKAEGSDPG